MDDPCSLGFGQELGRLGKVVDGEEGDDCHYNGQDAFKDEDPAPAFVATNTVHLL